MSGKKETYKLFNLPWYYFAIFAVLVLIATYTGTLPKGMSGCFAFMIVLGTILYEIGEKTPIIRSYLGGGAIVVLFGTALLNYFNLLPALTETLEDGTKVTTSTVFGGDATATAKWKKIHSTGTAVSATTYPITVKSAKNGDVTASHKSASKGTTVTLTVAPDKGYVLDTLTVLDGKDKERKLTDKGDGKFTFTMPDSKVTVEAMFKASAPTGKNPFIDVPAGSYYEDAVVWAVEKGITSGTSAVTFDPNGGTLSEGEASSKSALRGCRWRRH